MERVSLTEYLRAALGLPDAHPVLDFHLHALSGRRRFFTPSTTAVRLTRPPEPAKKLKRA